MFLRMFLVNMVILWLATDILHTIGLRKGWNVLPECIVLISCLCSGIFYAHYEVLLKGGADLLADRHVYTVVIALVAGQSVIVIVGSLFRLSHELFSLRTGSLWLYACIVGLLGNMDSIVYYVCMFLFNITCALYSYKTSQALKRK